MKLTELEKRLQEHAEIAKATVAAPFDIEREELSMYRKNFKFKTGTIVAAIICIFATTVFAAIHFLSPKELANELGDTTLAEYFDENEIISETKVDGKYKATILGIASGQRISKFKSSAWDLYPDRTYVAVAVEKSDGSAMTYDDEILVTPLIQDLSPWQYNIVTMHGGYSAQIIDGILYRIIECDSIEYFADKELYLAVVDGMFLQKEQYNFDESTGLITINEDYDGTNILFDLELDKSKANTQKATEYLETLKNESLDEEETTPIDDAEEYIVREDLELVPKEN